MGASHPAGRTSAPLIVAGLLLAAGEGRRMGVPKALLSDDTGVPYLDRAIGRLLDGGCATVTVVLGAAADEAVEILRLHGWTDDEDVTVIVNEAWAAGISSSLGAGLRSLQEVESGSISAPADAAMVLLVDLPDVPDEAVARLLALAEPAGLARATYDGRPGHPVLIGREHWTGVLGSVRGDHGARAYLDAHGVVDVPCDDLATGRDLDRPEDLER